jgi:hypothetical protein
MADKYKKEHTFLVVEKGNQEPLRWKSDNTLFFAGSVEDALEGLPQGEFVAIPVYLCSDEIQTEYEQLIDEKIKSGEIEI